jgi:thiol-disulfide isomerase/thioredoxin
LSKEEVLEMRKTSKTIWIILLLLLQLLSEVASAKESFFNQRYRGWLWFDRSKPDQSRLEQSKLGESQKEQSIQSKVPTPREAKAAIEARKKALDNARNIMIESAYRPGVTKGEFLKAVENYRNLEQEMQFMALKVGMAWDETNLLNPEYLDELNHPSNMYGRKKKEELDLKFNTAILKELAAKSELFVFRNGNCGYCHTLEKHLNRFAKKYGFKVEAVSPDGSTSPYFKTTHSKELIIALGLKLVPTVFLVADNDTHRYEIARGLVSIEGLERNTLQAAALLKQNISKSNVIGLGK